MTIKQKLAAKKVLENTGRPMGQIMEEVGYKPGSVKNPQQLTESKGWKELMDKYLPDDKILDVHDQLLDSKRDEIRLGAVGLGYKVKGKLQPEAVNTFNVGEMSVRFVERK